MSWLLAYDIASPRRWRRVYRRVSNIGHRLQFSLWWLPISDRALATLMQELAQEIDPATDDLRAYPFPANAWCRLWGPPPWGVGAVDGFSMRFRPSWTRGCPKSD